MFGEGGNQVALSAYLVACVAHVSKGSHERARVFFQNCAQAVSEVVSVCPDDHRTIVRFTELKKAPEAFAFFVAEKLEGEGAWRQSNSIEG